ncbi:MAG: hypothetical protein MUC48_13385 [Leptolyngbya sp. Prado105]|nr:hypothetical protein [Leptolyngbya sp. Prado105]
MNGVREASSTAQATVNQTARTYALATLLKARTGYTPTGAAGPGDDQIVYGLSLRVENNDPTGRGITPAPLAGMTVNGVSGSNILVSDAIPQGTTFVSAVAPAGWQAVYTADPTASIDANQATWSTTPVANITRVGFVRTGTIAPGTTVSGFQVTVAVTGTPASITVANIGQLFGSTPSQAPGQPGAPVYDESGDQNPSNYSDDGTPIAGTDTNNDGVPDTLPPTVIDDGFINTPTSPESGSDPGNNNTGQDDTPTQGGGEASIFNLNTPVPSAVSNGPEGAPEATGPSGTNNDDFTNASSPIPPNLVAGTNARLDPAPVAFTNTVQNSGTSPGRVVLTPQAPATPGHLPAGSTVTITAGSSSVTYTYDGAGNYTIGANNTGGQPIQINNVLPGERVNYGVEVNLPSNTPLSTDIDRGFPVPILASIFTDPDTVADGTNLTIDRVYTGYVKTVKESRILPGTGPAPAATDTTFSTDQKTPAPGNVIEYRITYTNISEPQSGTGNIILEAEQVVIDENGVSGANNTNNWARDNDNNGIIDTSNIVGSAVDSGTSTITFFSGNPATTGAADQTGTTATTDVTRYVNTATGIVAPQQARTFTFRRRMN